MHGCMSKRGCSNQTMKNCSCTSYSSTKRYSAVHNICTVHREIPSIDLDAIAAMTRDALSIYGAELQHHDPPAQGHPGYKAMLRNMQENYFWFDMAAHYKQYAVNCSTCRRIKVYNVKKQGLLNPLPVRNRKWMDLSLDFVVRLPESDDETGCSSTS